MKFLSLNPILTVQEQEMLVILVTIVITKKDGMPKTVQTLKTSSNLGNLHIHDYWSRGIGMLTMFSIYCLIL